MSTRAAAAMSRLPLTGHGQPDGIVAHRRQGPVTVAQFLADVYRLAELLPSAGSVFNACEDRYRFMVGLAAALTAGKVSLLPASHSPETLRHLRDFAADLVCLHDGKGEDVDLPSLRYPEQPVPADAGLAMPEIDEQALAAYLFTSGSTGAPMPHRRSWGSMVRNGRAEAERLGVLARGHAIVGTVPAQHSYGFESTVLLSLHGNCAAWSGRPFYPADIAAALAAVPRPRLLVTTPFHLRALLDAGVQVPPVDLLLSATAPLSEALAGEAESRLGAPLIEIYGCTESGQLASRRTSASQRWQPLAGVRIEEADGIAAASGGYVDGRVPLGDHLDLDADGSFRLLGRHADMINIAGKRSSLAYLDCQLGAIDGVDDGCFFMPDETGAAEAITRPCAFVVAPTLTPARILDALRSRVDAVFLPRPLILLERLPRNATGKLPRADLQALLDHHLSGEAI
jgi:acyl-coenzyme A synthetase/AMP-(fatty) acid ligase